MQEREYNLDNGYLYIVENYASYAVVYNHVGDKCMCLTTGCEFDFKGNDTPENKLISNINHKTLIETMNRHYGLEGTHPIIIPFRDVLYAFAPDLSRTRFFNKNFTADELENIEPFVEKILKSLDKKYASYVKEDKNANF